jgi:hypothetical protein
MSVVFQTVGATIGRPCSEISIFRRSSGELATLYCRAADRRPYIPASRLCVKLQFHFLFFLQFFQLHGNMF